VSSNTSKYAVFAGHLTSTNRTTQLCFMKGSSSTPLHVQALKDEVTGLVGKCEQSQTQLPCLLGLFLQQHGSSLLTVHWQAQSFSIRARAHCRHSVIRQPYLSDNHKSNSPYPTRVFEIYGVRFGMHVLVPRPNSIKNSWKCSYNFRLLARVKPHDYGRTRLFFTWHPWTQWHSSSSSDTEMIASKAAGLPPRELKGKV
jgi:hypothetical protein